MMALVVIMLQRGHPTRTLITCTATGRRRVLGNVQFLDFG